MGAHFLESAGALIVRLTPNTPPALWLPFAGYTAITIAAIAIALATLLMCRSRTAAAAAAIGFAVTATLPGGTGPLVLALAVLGLFVAPVGRVPGWLLFALILPAMFAMRNGALLTWCLAGCGLHYVASITTSRRWPRATGTALVVALLLIVITAPLPAAGRSAPPAPKPLGHDRATAASMRALLSNIPTGSDLIREDAVTGMLVRAVDHDFQRARVYVKPIDNDAASVRQELKMGRRVFALPHAQAALQLQGFQIVDSLHVANRGLAEVVAGGDCVTATAEWQTVNALTARKDLAFVADRESRRGPVVIYLIGDEPIHIGAPNWPTRTMRGFSPRTFDLANARDRQELDRQRAEDLGPEAMDISKATSVTRVALWRMPDAALAMPITLSAPATYAAVKLAPEADRPVSVCPAFPATVSAIR